MKKDEAERRIMAEMRRRLPERPYRGADGGLLQYLQLQNERPDLFAFKWSGGDKWQLVAAWLKRHRLVS